MTYRTTPAQRDAEKWHKLLNNGHRLALVDSTGRVILAARYAWQLEQQHRRRPDLKQINIADQIDK
ncbi:TPA: hypothetical protein QH074_004328 [Enterobacter hormaechei subsp. steigerwaltii]|nr:hypothetical protein [Enterobacter hormaechei subsp. steigerwaltii]